MIQRGRILLLLLVGALALSLAGSTGLAQQGLRSVYLPAIMNAATPLPDRPELSPTATNDPAGTATTTPSTDPASPSPTVISPTAQNGGGSTPTATSLVGVTPTATSTPVGPIVETADDLLKLPWVRSVLVFDQESGQATVTIMPNAESGIVPTDWTIYYDGANYDSGQTILFSMIETAQASAPARILPLLPTTFTKDIPAVCSVPDLQTTGHFATIQVLDAAAGVISATTAISMPNILVYDRWSSTYNGIQYASGQTIDLDPAQRLITLQAPAACLPLSTTRFP